MQKKVTMKDQNNEELITLTVEGKDLEAVKESCRRWGSIHNSTNIDITKNVHSFEIDGETYDIEDGE